MSTLYHCESLPELQQFLAQQPAKKLQPQLIKEFLQYALYTNAKEWNKAVRLCEALAIIGWGDHEPVEAQLGRQFNGNPSTAFYNRFAERRFVSTNWSKRKTGFTIDPRGTQYHASPELPQPTSPAGELAVHECIQDIALATQRNWIPRNPIQIRRAVSNCYASSRQLVDEITNQLAPALDRQMQPEKYGSAINWLLVGCYFSYQNPGVRTNYVLVDEDIRLSTPMLASRLRTMYSKQEIAENGYYLRKRYDLGEFQRERGHMKVEVHFSKEFSTQSHDEQKQEFAQHMITAINGIVDRLRRKKLEYDFERMNADFQSILKAWAMLA